MLRSFIALVLITSIAGCAKETPVYPVTGTVKLANGAPAVGCVVEFTSEADGTKGINATGEVQADGTFKLSSSIEGKLREGAVAGPHKVIVTPPSASSGGPPPLTIPTRYSSPDQSGLAFEVKPGATNNYPITLDAK